MPRSTFAGHALHPQLIVVPAGLLPFSFAMDAMNLMTGKKSFADAAYYTMVGGLLGGLAAGTAGAIDYLGIPVESNTKRTANMHAILNIAALSLVGLNLLLRSKSRQQPRVGAFPAFLSLATATGVIVSSWYGGKMSYIQGMRVHGVSEVETTREIKLPGDEAIHQAFEKLEEVFAPTGGPATSDSRAATTAVAIAG